MEKENKLYNCSNEVTDPTNVINQNAEGPIIIKVKDNRDKKIKGNCINKRAKKGKAKKRQASRNMHKSTKCTKATELELEGIYETSPKTRIVVKRLQSPESYGHEVTVYPGQEYIQLQPLAGTSAKVFPFTLDPFQKLSIQCIDNNESVFVSAHTSAGKTVIAQYAIAKALHSAQRVIYTAPIKALSNQKYRDFNEEFTDVGLITGDVTINPGASCLIMTTEILRNVLLRGGEVMRNVGWVIFDEIHYMRDKNRGVVWEESLILLPDNVRYIFLSATLPNARQFAEWICYLHKQPCHVVYTDGRPIPLQHYIFPAGSDGLRLIVDEKGQFIENNFNAAMDVLPSNNTAEIGVTSANSVYSNIMKVVLLIMERSLSPVIVFTFSKKSCEDYATNLGKLEFNGPVQKKIVDKIFNKALNILREEDRHLCQVKRILPLLHRGIGIHHAGLLPILKEIIEILFGEGLIKVLFATETFAMGLNMPARTVLFTQPCKFDGESMRWISSNEYIQMAGRAGRRGIDEKGMVILMINQKISQKVLRNIVQGKPHPINSAFRLTYNMILNLLRVKGINPEYMLERSYLQFQNNSLLPDLYKTVLEKYMEFNKIHIKNENSIASYYDIKKKLYLLHKEFRYWITNPLYLVPFLKEGRLLKMEYKGNNFGWAVLVNSFNAHHTSSLSKNFSLDVLLHISEESVKEGVPKLCRRNQKGNMEIVNVSPNLITEISSLRIICPRDLKPADNRRSVLKIINGLKKIFPKGLPLIDPIKDMEIEGETFEKLVDSIREHKEQLNAHPLYNLPDINQLYNNYKKKMKLLGELNAAKTKYKAAETLQQLNELKHRKCVLRRMKYCRSSDVIKRKGRVACEISSGDELLLTEMIFDGIFNNLTIPQTVSLLSCFVCDEESSKCILPPEELFDSYYSMQRLARRIVQISKECNIQLCETEYLKQFKPSLMKVVLEWCKGESFRNVCQMTDLFEGTVIRCLRRLEDLLREMQQAAKTIDDTKLENKFSEGIRLLKRDIVCASSLYV